MTEAALRSCALTVQVSTKLNRSHVVHGRTALILPTLGRTDRDIQAGGKQLVSVEDSMSMVHLSRGSLHPPSEHLRSEVAIVCQLARPFSARTIRCRGRSSRATTTASATPSPTSSPAAPTTTREVRQPDGFQLPHPPRDSREFPTTTGKANFAVNPLEWVPVPEGRLVLQTLRSHDQYNTTIYGLDDRYRGVKGGRRVVFVNPADIDALGLAEGDARRPGFRVHQCRRQCRGAARQGLPRRAVLDAAWATPRPTIRRPIRWCRWTTRRRGRTPRIQGRRDPAGARADGHG